MLHALGPGHLADVYQAFNPLLQFHERAVIGDADHPSAYVRTHWITMLRVEPRIRGQLLKPERDPLLLFVKLENLHLDLIADVDQVTGMSQASPRHVGDMK